MGRCSPLQRWIDTHLNQFIMVIGGNRLPKNLTTWMFLLNIIPQKLEQFCSRKTPMYLGIIATSFYQLFFGTNIQMYHKQLQSTLPIPYKRIYFNHIYKFTRQKILQNQFARKVNQNKDKSLTQAGQIVLI